MALKNLIPMINVSDIQQSLDFYATALHFEIVSDPDAVKEWRWALIRSGNTELMLSESTCREKAPEAVDQNSDSDWPVIFYFYPDNVVELHTYMQEKNNAPSPLKLTEYGMREFSLIDPDGHLLCFGQEDI